MNLRRSLEKSEVEVGGKGSSLMGGWTFAPISFFRNFIENQPNMADLILEITKLSIADRIKLVQEILSTVAKDVESQDFGFVDEMLAESEADIAAGSVYTTDEAKAMLEKWLKERH
jgi:hypothetical protein